MAIAPRFNQPLPYQGARKRSSVSPFKWKISTTKSRVPVGGLPAETLTFLLLRVVPLALALIIMAVSQARIVKARNVATALRISRSNESGLFAMNTKVKSETISDASVLKWATDHHFEKSPKIALMITHSSATQIVRGN